ncbi:Toxin ToxN, type III toxin-antitoxin system [Sporolituus thermophilus DSM 23256]|uniref:Toxin ToxN, type III toxin-antitoxin system n=1 Tax=Sporolituus thermophilus DSM 23256 TaxID=1123285 RepID=A0A1G7HF99_9FIRM|nr:Toxin ToxN, type III toxin-antitoxin system [Sporolituus thermophilus DSM 23256]
MSEILMCRIDIAYLNYLRQFDSRVSYNDSGTRMFVGILLEVNGQKYYAPL